MTPNPIMYYVMKLLKSDLEILKCYNNRPLLASKYHIFHLREITIKLLDKDYLDFLMSCVDEELTVEGKLTNYIKYHLITYRNKQKIRNQKLFF